jgi:hypothetical protein
MRHSEAASDLEPIRPGWYPTGFENYQRYYAGRGQGWTNDFRLKVEAQAPRATSSDLALLALGGMLVGVGVLLGLLLTLV